MYPPVSKMAFDDTSIMQGPLFVNVKNPDAGSRTDVPDPNGCDSTWLLQMSATAGVNSRDVTRIATCWPPVPVNE